MDFTNQASTILCFSDNYTLFRTFFCDKGQTPLLRTSFFCCTFASDFKLHAYVWSRNTWLNYVFVLVIFCLLPSFSFVSSVTEMWLEGKSWEAIWAFQVEVWEDIATSVSWWLIVPITIAIWLRAMMQNAKNKYVIDGDTLIIQENFILKTEEKIRIPIDCIEDVYTSSKWALNPYLWIKVNGVTRRCHSYPHSLELGKAILRHKHALSSNN